jgi:hypothetical protein
MARSNANATEGSKPEITKVEYNFPTEDDLRTNRRGEQFDRMQESDIEFVNADRRVATQEGNDAVRIWFENGAHIRYELVDETTVTEAVYRSDNPSSVWDSIEITLSYGGREDFIACVENGLDEYLSSRREAVSDFEGDWTTVYEIIKE